MVNVTTTDVLTEQRIRRVIDEEREYPLVFNEAFETITMGDDVPNKTLEIPEDDAVMSEPEPIAEGSEFPRTEEDVSTTSVTVQKYGFEVAITWEATQFSVFDVVARQTEKAARRFNEYINRLAYNEVSDSNNQHPNSPVDANGSADSTSFDFQLVTEAQKYLKDDQVMPDMMVVNTEGEKQILNSDNFQRASDLGDEVTRDGAIGRFAGLDVMVDNSGLMSDTNPEGYLIDTDEYGMEVVKQDIGTDEYEDKSRQSQIVQWFTMRAWHVQDPEAAIKFEDTS
jgi:N4-gp56 family major capsid protein